MAPTAAVAVRGDRPSVKVPADNLSTDDRHRMEMTELFQQLRHQAIYGMKYFQGTDGPTNRRFYSAYAQLLGHVAGGVESGVDHLLRIASLFDLDSSAPGNGYRSIVSVVERCCARIHALCRYVRGNRESYLFRAAHYSRELDAYVTTLGQLRACLYYLRKLATYCRAGELFASECLLTAEQYGVAERLMTEVEALCQESFYGRCLGFQFCASMLRPLATINVVMAAYGDGYGSSSRVMTLATSLLASSKYVTSPELRAKQVVNMTRNSDIHFCKAFWALGENVFMHKLPLCMCPGASVDRVILIPLAPVCLSLARGGGTTIIQPPPVTPGAEVVRTRLISSVLRSGQADAKGASGGSVHPPSPSLVIHCHGGGFVAQSSASHQVYLRQWAADLAAPVLSVDYTLAPQEQFPRQLDEVFHAYCWALANPALLGWTGERVCLVGDSAGGNLAVAVAMRAEACGVRAPTGVVSIYGCLLVKYTPSPSRILALMDPLVPLGALSMCLGAYAGLSDDDTLTADGSPPEPSTLGDATPDGPFNHLATPHLLQMSNIRQSFPGGAVRPVVPPVENPRLIRQHARNNSGDSGICDSSETPRRRAIGRSVDQSERGDATFNENEAMDEEMDENEGFVNIDAEFESYGRGNDLERHNRRIDDDRMAESFSFPDEIRSESQPGYQDLIHARQRVSSCGCEHSTDIRPSEVEPIASALADPAWHDPANQNESKQRSADRCFHDLAKFANLRHFAQSPMRQSKRVSVSGSPYLSPLLAPDAMLSRLPPVHLVACELDPMLDDSVMFARRLRAIHQAPGGGTISNEPLSGDPLFSDPLSSVPLSSDPLLADPLFGDPGSGDSPVPVKLDLLPDLPHGFLNFVLVSAEAKAGSDRCVAAIRGLLQGGKVPCTPPSSSPSPSQKSAGSVKHSVGAIARVTRPLVKVACPIVDSVLF